MTIVDKTHASQVVTKKGKQFKYDAIECMVNDILKQNNEPELAVMQVANYSNPGEMIKTSEAYFFISKAIQSPMGANLSAVSTKEAAEKIIAEQGGTRISWDELKEKITAQNKKQ
jgi:copper chaperone NosL